MTYRYKSPAQELATIATQAAMMSLLTNKTYKPKIGQYYNSLSNETKNILKNLTSNEARNIRYP